MNGATAPTAAPSTSPRFLWVLHLFTTGEIHLSQSATLQPTHNGTGEIYNLSRNSRILKDLQLTLLLSLAEEHSQQIQNRLPLLVGSVMGGAAFLLVVAAIVVVVVYRR